MKKHMFAVCAYKESEHLEECVKSLLGQTVKSGIIMCTSTPNEHIKNIAARYDIPLYIRKGKSDIKDDWNFAYNMADASYVTVAHQDDVYDENYVKYMANAIDNADDKFVIYLTDYMPIKHGRIGKRDVNCKIRRFLRSPLKIKALSGKKFVKKGILSMGNSICCPAVTYNKAKLGPTVFTSELKFNIDWDTFLRLAEIKGRFLYTDKPLTYYRVYDGATSKEFIENNGRIVEDTEMFNKFWPGFVTKIIMIFYKKAYKTYED